MSAILTLNTGSSSVKFGLYNACETPVPLVQGQIRRIGGDAELVLTDEGDSQTASVVAADPSDAIEAILVALKPYLMHHTVIGVGHRIVHGGVVHSEPAEMSADILDYLKTLEPLAPLHQPFNLAGVIAARNMFPDALQIGCFDTAFHRHHPFVNDTFALPRRFFDEGVRRYGFHGLSCTYITQHLARSYPDIHQKRCIIAHLGNGASLCALQGGKSVGSSMGFSALDGMPMGTRCGQLDPGVILYLLDQKAMNVQDVTDLLYKQSGLLGLSGISGDMETLLASQDPRSEDAIAYYVSRAQREIGALSAILGGLDGLVFCGGVGENAPVIRERICTNMQYLGLEVDKHKNSQGHAEIGCGTTRILVVPTNEEFVIANAVLQAL